jgi:CheY-like chemotaxis protein
LEIDMDAALNIAHLASEVLRSDDWNRLQVHPPGSDRRPNRGGLMRRVVARRPLRVLVVDDDRDTADTLAMLVGLWGHDVRRAYDGATGLAMAKALAPDVVLLDVAMPGMGGCELAGQLHVNAGLQECFLIAVTGYADKARRLECEEAGIDLFLVKPVDVSVMETLLMLERQRLGLSPTDSILIDAKSAKHGAARKAVPV